MSDRSKRALFWAPRALSIALIAFVSFFAMDVFEHHLDFWRTVLALTMHLIPSFVLIGVLVLAWRREWIGAALFAAAGLLHVVWVVSVDRRWSPAQRLSFGLLIAGPAFLIAGLFLANWVETRRTARPVGPSASRLKRSS